MSRMEQLKRFWPVPCLNLISTKHQCQSALNYAAEIEFMTLAPRRSKVPPTLKTSELPNRKSKTEAENNKSNI